MYSPPFASPPCTNRRLSWQASSALLVPINAVEYELADITKEIDIFISKFSEKYPNIKVELIDERFTSKMAFQTMIDSGIGKKARQNKALIDKISATIILENYLDWNK